MKKQHSVVDICPNCDGRGDVNIGLRECKVCSGTGRITFEEVGKIIELKNGQKV